VFLVANSTVQFILNIQLLILILTQATQYLGLLLFYLMYPDISAELG